VKNRVLSVHQEHELLVKLEQAGLSETDAQAVIQSKGNALAKELIEVIRGVKVEGDFFLFPTSALTLNELWERNQDLLYQGSNRWWKDRPFANQKGKVGKLLLRTSAAPGSFNKTWGEQQGRLSEGEYVPTVRDLVEGMIYYHRVNGKRIFSDYWVRSQDVSSFGRRVNVGFYSDGVHVSFYWDDFPDSFIGLAVAWKSA